MEKGKIHLTLNPITGVVILGTLLLAMFFSYQIGSTFAGSSDTTQADAGQSELELAKTGLPDAGVLGKGAHLSGERPAADRSGGAVNASSGAATGQSAGSLVPGLNYVILCSYGNNIDVAQFVQQWLAEKHGLQTELKKKGGDIVLINPQGFSERQQWEQYIQKIKLLDDQVKKELIRAGKKVYGFADPYAYRHK